MPDFLLWLIPLLPFAGFLINGTLGRKLPRAAVTAVALLFTAIPAAARRAGSGSTMRRRRTCRRSPSSAALDRDHRLSGRLRLHRRPPDAHHARRRHRRGFLIHLYSVGYMAHDDGYWRFFAYLNLFMFFMLVLVLAENFLLLFVGWEGVGLASYLLIGFYFKKDSAANAGKKAFIVNRIGDFGFLLAMFLLIAHFGSLNFTTRLRRASPQHPDWHGGFLTAIALLLVLGAAGKSAQIPLYVWLPDAMEGPTPVSALIHAATMVTAGIYMVARCHTLFDRSPYALTVVAIIGAATAIFAASIGMVQHDIKRVLAYSTVSQLGYMFLACGVGAYSAAIFHLHDPRLLQGAALPRRRLRHPRPLRRAGHAQHGRPAQAHPHHLLDHDDRRLRHRRHPAPRRLLLQGRDPLPGVHLSANPPRQAALARRSGHRRHDLASTCSASGSRPSSAPQRFDEARSRERSRGTRPRPRDTYPRHRSRA